MHVPGAFGAGDAYAGHMHEIFGNAGCSFSIKGKHKGDTPNAIRLTSTVFIGIIRGALPF